MADDKGEPAPMDVEEKAATAAEPNASAPETNGPRKRKQVEFFAPADVKKVEKLVIKEGKGTKLADIPNVVFHFSKVTGKDELLEELHFLLFKRKGKLATRKKEILGFSGFVYEGSAEEGRAKLAEKLNKWKLEDIHRLMDMLDLARGGGSKEAKVNALMEFLEAPKVLKDVDLAEKAAKAKEKAKSKKEKETAKKEKESAKKEKEVAKKEKAAEKEPAKKKAKKETPAKEEGTAKKKAKPAPKKKAKAPVEEPEEDEEDDEDDEVPLAKAAAAPSDEELRKETLAILEDAQLEDFTMKDLLRQLSEKYKMPLQNRRDFLKKIVNSFVTEQQTSAADGDKEEPDEAAEPEETAAAQEEAAAEPMEVAEEPEEPQEAVEEPVEAAPAEEKPAEEPAEAAAAEEKPGEAEAPNAAE